ncbi:hypothetical protein SL22_05486 [Klebsiella pneumoniae]|uniref:hypothetical protein n=1 Tax=Klebsiella TaxID=570 RepID=UPI00063C023B|nr:hypothetical protein YA26_10210 [Klebsiella aerogenes]KLZ71095.1 hypothetical protein SL22_05486 [Klebsiella pneumoniae]
MTKSTITREQAELRAFITGFLTDQAHDKQSADSLTAKVFRIALAAMDSEPVGEFYEDGPLNWYQISDGDRVPAHRRIPLYRHAPVVPDRYIFEVNVGGSTWVQCSEKDYENAKSKGELTRVLYEHPSAAVFLKD